MLLFCSTAGFVYMACLTNTKPALSRFSNALKIIALSFHFNTSNTLTFRMSSEQIRLRVPPKLNQRFTYSLTLRITRATSVMTTDTSLNFISGTSFLQHYGMTSSV